MNREDESGYDSDGMSTDGRYDGDCDDDDNEDAQTTVTSEDDGSMRSASPMPSVLGIDDDVRAAIIRKVNGRGMSAFNEMYLLPVDEEEFERLDMQDNLFAQLMGGRFPEVLREVMADDVPGEPKRCLDLGCGSGKWITDIAREFPNCEAVAIDLVPMQAADMPLNLRSEVDDINLGLEHFYGSFDVVHARLIASGIRDYHRLVDQVSQVLRPGGLAIFVDFDFHMYDAAHRRIEWSLEELGPPWCSLHMTVVGQAIAQSGGDIDAANHIKEWVSMNPEMEGVEEDIKWLPVVCPKPASWPEGPYQDLKRDAKAFVGTGRATMLSANVDPEMVDLFCKNAEQEIDEARLIQMTCLHRVHARKKKSS